ncbi:hypothetical protein BDF19DRAFT_8014 [Syncephalis fuscata]|nr:hypothetical protein BDF19DRAFT_8014 [Syncephalis fuscata]
MLPVMPPQLTSMSFKATASPQLADEDSLDDIQLTVEIPAIKERYQTPTFDTKPIESPIVIHSNDHAPSDYGTYTSRHDDYPARQAMSSTPQPMLHYGHGHNSTAELHYYDSRTTHSHSPILPSHSHLPQQHSAHYHHPHHHRHHHHMPSPYAASNGDSTRSDTLEYHLNHSQASPSSHSHPATPGSTRSSMYEQHTPHQHHSHMRHHRHYHQQQQQPQQPHHNSQSPYDRSSILSSYQDDGTASPSPLTRRDRRPTMLSVDSLLAPVPDNQQ